MGSKNIGMHPNVKLDKIGVVFNGILGSLYFPISWFSLLAIMVSDGPSHNQLYSTLLNIFCIVTLTTPLICILSIVLSIILRKKHRSVASFCIQFLGLIVFILNWAMFTYAGKINI